MFKSQGLGHIATSCPNGRVITLIEWEAIQEDDMEEKQESNDEVKIKGCLRRGGKRSK